MRKSFVGMAAVVVLVAGLISGCGSAAPAATTAPAATATAPAAPAATPAEAGVALPEVNPLDVQGDIITAGSSTVFPLSERMAERFRDEGYAGNLTIDSIGSGAGFERFCQAGETDIANASRGIKDSEIESCRAIGREPLEIRVGTDALAVVVSQENDFINDVTLEQLAAIFSADATNWSDVNPDWPAEPIQRFIPGTDSGTFDYFVEEVFDGDEARSLSAANQQMSEDDNVLVQGVLGSPYAIGYFGYAYYSENADTLRVLSINGVEATDATVDSGDYALARPLYLYTDADIDRLLLVRRMKPLGFSLERMKQFLEATDILTAAQRSESPGLDD